MTLLLPLLLQLLLLLLPPPLMLPLPSPPYLLLKPWAVWCLLQLEPLPLKPKWRLQLPPGAKWWRPALALAPGACDPGAVRAATARLYVQPLAVFSGLSKAGAEYGGGGLLAETFIDLALIAALLLHRSQLKRRGLWHTRRHADAALQLHHPFFTPGRGASAGDGGGGGGGRGGYYDDGGG